MTNPTPLIIAEGQEWIDKLLVFFQEDIVPILGAFLILLIGYLVAKIVAGLVGKLFTKTALDERLAAAIDVSSSKIAGVASLLAFWIIMLFVLIAFFGQLKLPMVSEPIQAGLNQLTPYLFKVAGALALLFVAFVVATVVRMLLSKLLAKVGLDEKFARVEPEEAVTTSLSRTISEAAYWLIFLLFLPGILGTLELSGMLDPVNEMVREITAFLPNVLGAIVLFAIGYFVARIIQRILANLLAATGLNLLGEKVGLKERKLSDLIGLFAFILILVPILVGAIGALGLTTISEPAKQMMNDALIALPGIIGGILVLGVFYFVGKLVSGLATEILSGIGFDNVLTGIGIAGPESKEGKAPSDIAGVVILFLLVFIGLIQGLELAELTEASDFAKRLLESTFNILLGVVIFGIGLYLGNFVAGAIASTKAKHADVLAFIAKVAIIIIVGFMALDQTGLADDVTSDTFTALIYGLAAAFAIAFGWAGKDTAAKLLGKLESNLKLKEKDLKLK